ncbi:MAG TPA: NERD domain-containing protein, partial [Streptosporangiaceae bacterium]
DWDKRLIVRTKSGKQLYHGPNSMKDRLEHALWEAQRAADLLSDATGRRVAVRPAMAVYGPKIPWDVATIREVDVFSGPRLRKYLRRRAKNRDVQPLTDEEIERIFKAADEAFPHLSSGSPAA